MNIPSVEIYDVANFAPIVSEMFNAKVYYVLEECLQALIKCVYTHCFLNISDDIKSLKIKFDTGETYIFVVGSDCINVQKYYDYTYYQLFHFDKYNSPDDYYTNYIYPVNSELDKFMQSERKYHKYKHRIRKFIIRKILKLN